MVGRHLRGDAVEVPEAADDELAEDQAHEEGDALAESLATAVAQDDELQDPGDKEREPDEVDLPTAGDGEAEGMERPPGVTGAHGLEEERDEEAGDHGQGRGRA